MIADIVKKSLPNAVCMKHIDKRKTSLLEDESIKNQFKERSIDLADIGDPTLSYNFKDES